jgi:hypothetical protein
MSLLSSLRTAGPFIGNGSIVVLPFTFPVDAAEDIKVTKSVNAVVTPLVLNIEYYVTLNPDQSTSPGGSVFLVSALAVGESAYIESNLDFTQPTQLPPGGDYEAKVVEGALDRVVKLVQQLWARMLRTVTVPAIATGINPELPVPQSGRLLAWNSSGNKIENVTPESLLTQAGSSGFKHQLFSPSGTQTSFTLDENPGLISNTDVALNGVVQRPGVDYTLSGSVITMSALPPAGTDSLLVRWGQTYPINFTNPVVSLDVNGPLNVGGNTTIGGTLSVGDPNLGFELSGAVASAKFASNAAVRYDRLSDQMSFIVSGAPILTLGNLSISSPHSIFGGRDGARGFAAVEGGISTSTGSIGFYTNAGVRQGSIGSNQGSGLAYDTDNVGSHIFYQNIQFNSQSGAGLQNVGYRGAPPSFSGLRDGEVWVVTGWFTLNLSDLAPGREYGVYNDSSNEIVIAQGPGVTLRKDGTDTTGDMTIPQRKLVAIWCLSSTEAILVGAKP